MTTAAISRLQVTRWPHWPEYSGPGFRPSPNSGRTTFNPGLIQVRCEEDLFGLAGQLVFAFHVVNSSVRGRNDETVGKGFCLDKLVQFGARDLAAGGRKPQMHRSVRPVTIKVAPAMSLAFFHEFHARGAEPSALGGAPGGYTPTSFMRIAGRLTGPAMPTYKPRSSLHA